MSISIAHLRKSMDGGPTIPFPANTPYVCTLNQKLFYEQCYGQANRQPYANASERKKKGILPPDSHCGGLTISSFALAISDVDVSGVDER